jgi:AsmA protein
MAAMITGLLIAGVGAAGVGYLMVAPPVDIIRQQVSAPLGMGGEPLVTMAGLDASVKLWPMLQRQISVERLVLRQPVFDLRVDKTGKRSWDFAAFDEPLQSSVRYAQAGPPKGTATDLPDAVKDFMDNASDPANPSPHMKAKLARLEELTLGDVRIEGGTFIYADQRTGAAQQVSAVDARVGLKSLASPLDATGKLVFDGQPFDFDVKLASMKAILEDRPAKLAVTVKGLPIDLRYDGTITIRAGVEAEGDVTAKGPSLRALTHMLGHDLPPADGFGAVALSGKLKALDKTLTLTDANLGLDGATATGSVLLDTSGARPRINANLKISALDLNRYTLAAGTSVAKAPLKRPVAAASQAPPNSASTAPGAPAIPAAPAAKSIEELINGPQVKGYTKRAGWSEERVPLDALGEFDADAKISVGKLHFHDVKVGPSAVTVALKAKVLKLTFDDVQLYDGRGKGFIQIDANPAAPVVGANFSVDGVAAQALLKDVADFELLAGAGRLTVAVGAQGASESELVQTANGKADFAFTNGAIVGYNIPGAIRGLTQGKFSGFGKVATDKTDFSELAASFTIANGVATNQDLRFVGALPGQTVNYVVKPKLVASLQGQGGTDALAGIEVPIIIKGPWASPDITPDVNAILKDPSKVIEAAKEIGKQFEKGGGKDIGKAVKDLLGKDDGKGGEEIDGKKVKKLLDGLFR